MSDKAYDESIRLDERERLAMLLEDHAEALGRFTSDPEAAVRLVAFLIRLKPHD